MEVLFVCRANVARSQMAEAIFNKLSKKSHRTHSAGVDPDFYEGKTMKEVDAWMVIGVMKEMGVDISGKVSKRMTKEMFDKADRVIVMIDKEDLPIYAQDSKKVTFWDIPDLSGRSYEHHLAAREKIKGHVEKLVKEVG